DELAVLDYRDALDALALEESGNLGERRLFGNRDHARGHNFADLLAVRLGEVGGERARPSYRLRPPWPTLLGSDLDSIVKNGKSANVVLPQKLDRLRNIGIGTDGHDVVDHDIDSAHAPSWVPGSKQIDEQDVKASRQHHRHRQRQD